MNFASVDLRRPRRLDMSSTIEKRHDSSHAAHRVPGSRFLSYKAIPAQLASEMACQRIRRALEASGYRALRQVEVHVHEGLVRLSGSVGSYYYKQRATAVVLPLDGVEQLRNELTVASRDHS